MKKLSLLLRDLRYNQENRQENPPENIMYGWVRTTVLLREGCQSEKNRLYWILE
ncbi:MAG: hypothetical protein ACOX8K_08175 [Lachnospiraceae bacterium]|jgi:hypothetical protein